MKCPHCRTSFHDAWDWNNLTLHGTGTGWRYYIVHCPECREFTIQLSQGEGQRRQVIPLGSSRAPTPTDVPLNIATDYEEACTVLPFSPKASAALSRRSLQSILRAHGYQSGSLAAEIELLLNEPDPKKAIPQSLVDTVDLIRNFGNFSAHPITDQTTLQIIDIEPEEAETCLEIIEEMFEHFYVRPARAAAKKAALNAKLANAGKPAAK